MASRSQTLQRALSRTNAVAVTSASLTFPGRRDLHRLPRGLGRSRRDECARRARDGSAHNEPHDCALYARPRSLALAQMRSCLQQLAWRCAKCNRHGFARRSDAVSRRSETASLRFDVRQIAETAPRGALHHSRQAVPWVQAGRRGETELWPLRSRKMVTRRQSATNTPVHTRTSV